MPRARFARTRGDGASRCGLAVSRQTARRGRFLLLSGFRGVARLRRRCGCGDGVDAPSPEKRPSTPRDPYAAVRKQRNNRAITDALPDGAVGAAARGGGVMSMGRVEKDQARVHIRWMIRRDMPEVLHIEQQSFEYAWTEEDFLRCLQQRNCIGMVAEHGEKVVGFMIYELHKSKLHILNFAVNRGYRRMGIGNQMVSKLIGKLSSHRRTKITLAVRETNLAAQLFFRSQDFKAVKVLRDYYEDSGEDAYLMEYRIADEPGDDTDEPVNRIAQFHEDN